MHGRRHSYHSTAATHWNDSDHPHPGGTYSPPVSHAQASQYPVPHSQNNNVSSAAYRTVFSGASQQYSGQPGGMATPNYPTYTPTSSGMTNANNSGYQERRNQSPPFADVYSANPSQSSTLSSSYPPHNSPPLYSQSCWQPSAQYDGPIQSMVPATHRPVLYQSPLGPGLNLASQHPASPPRPYACDMCPLSFNRQHDLKRHRETHSGEKPYLCNGGCGKTFTRKDALKRHQLVKGCGKPEDVWS